jgi:fatty-acyl-CoA synthase
MLYRNLAYAYEGSVDPLIGKTIGDILDETVLQNPQREALVVRWRKIRWTYQRFLQEVDQAARGMMRIGIQKGDRVGIWSTNNERWPVTQFATAKIGAILVNINPAYRSHELKYALKKSDVQTLLLCGKFKQTNYVKILHEVVPELAGSKPGNLKSKEFPLLKNIVYIMDEKMPDMFSWYDLLAKGDEVSITTLEERGGELDFDDPINVQYTSGTTGFPKGVTLTHFNLVNNAKFVGKIMKLSGDDRLCIPVPFYHCFGMVLGNLCCVVNGATMIIPDEVFEPLSTIETIQAERCTALHGVPTMFISQLNHPEFQMYDFSTLRTGIMAGAPCPIDTMRQVNNLMHAKEITIAYGQTEAAPVITMTRADDTIMLRTQTIGKPIPHVEVKIADPQTGMIVQCGEQGELCTRGYHVMKGYYNDPDATAETIDKNGWLHTGDLATMDEDGYCKITGRLKDMVIRGGENIYPREIEEFLMQNPKIIDAQVIGVPDKKYGEELCAWIKLKPGETLTEEEIKAYCKGKISHFKIPRYIQFVDEYPMTVTGKVQKYKMRDLAIEQLDLSDIARMETA